MLTAGGLALLSSTPYAAAQSTAKVSIQNFAFSPNTITVVIGENNTVTWTNMDSTTHTVTSTSVPSGAQSYNSGNLAPGGTFTNTFTVPGTYTYHCSIHTYMTGKVIVKGATVSTTPTTSTTAGGGIPEFPFQGVLVAAVTLAVLASYLVVRRGRVSGGSLASSAAAPGRPDSGKILK